MHPIRDTAAGLFARARPLAWPAIASIALCTLALPARGHSEPAQPEFRQALDDAWWTGPLLANSAATLGKGHFLVEPYFYDAISDDGHSLGSLTYLLYGATDKLTVGAIPVFGYNEPRNGPGSTGVGTGDIGLLAQYQLRSFRKAGHGPDISLQLQETLPTGRYDRLDDRPGDGFGNGVRSTLLQLNTQSYFWMRNGRILRMRANIGETFSRRATIDGASVHGTPAGFHGTIDPGSATSISGAWEYSLTQHWVLALDLAYTHRRRSRIRGTAPAAETGESTERAIELASRDTYGIAPAIEYNFTPLVGVIFGARYLKTPGAGDSLTPVVAINFVH
jgi:hypothetical protein